MKITYLFAGLAILIFAQSVAWSQSDQECDYSGNQSQMNACAMNDFKTADSELNQNYKQLVNSLEHTQRMALIEEQRTWLKERDPKCRKEADVEAEGGSMWPMLFNSCRATFTQTRIKQLKFWMDKPSRAK